MRRLALVLLTACHAPAAPTAAAPTAAAPPAAAARSTAPPSDRVDAVLYGSAFFPASAAAIGVMVGEDGVEDKTIVVSDLALTCDQAIAAWNADRRSDRTITMSMIGWKDGYVTTFQGDSGSWAATFDGIAPELADDPEAVRGAETATGTVTTLHAASGIGALGRVRFDLRGEDDGDHARGEVDVIQCE